MITRKVGPPEEKEEQEEKNEETSDIEDEAKKFPPSALVLAEKADTLKAELAMLPEQKSGIKSAGAVQPAELESVMPVVRRRWYA